MEYLSPLVSLRRAGVFCDNRWLVRDINLDIISGEIITLIGPNGSGKSTTAKMVLGILRPTEGRVERRLGIRIGYVPQKIIIRRSFPLNVVRMMQLTGPVDKLSLDQALHEVGMLHMQNVEISTLSCGELQRVMLARASVRNPHLLVLDEPLQGIDSPSENSLSQLICTYRERMKCAVLLISHNLHVVMATSDRILCLNGHICCEGKPHDVAESREYLSLFGEKNAPFLAVYKNARF